MSPIDLLLRTRSLTLGYGSRSVLRDVNLEVGTDQFWFIVGPNGQGKTTLLRALLGLLRPHRGELWVHPERASHDCIGFVPQRSEFKSTLPTTVREFVSLGLVGARAQVTERQQRLASALETAGLGSLAGQSFASLSGGQRRRALVARALVRSPDLLMLDEPTAGLDIAAEDAFLRFLERLRRDAKLTVLFVTHDLRIVARHATHVALVHDGRVESGTRDAILRSESLARAYGVPIDVRNADGGLEIHVAGGDA